mgnify:CR=1 FL=1
MSKLRLLSGIVIGASWFTLAGRWLWGARGGEQATAVRMSGGNAAWIAANVVAFAGLARFGYRLRKGRRPMAAAGATLAVAGVATSLLARRELGTNWSKDAALVEHQELVREGPYSLMRHPIYTGFIALMTGTALFAASAGAWLLVAAHAVFLLRKALEEDALLEDEFGEDYGAYRAETPAFVPGLKR